MKQVTLKVSNCSVAQWSTLLLELNLVQKTGKDSAPRSSSKRQASPADQASNKQQAQAASATIWPDLYDSKKNEKKILVVGLFYTIP